MIMITMTIGDQDDDDNGDVDDDVNEVDDDLDDVDDDGDGYPAYSHHDKIPPWWVIVSDDEGGNVPVSKTHHTP